MAVVYVPMYFKCKICFTVYTGETKINDTYLLTYLITYDQKLFMNVVTYDESWVHYFEPH